MQLIRTRLSLRRIFCVPDATSALCLRPAGRPYQGIVCRQISLLIHPDRCKHPQASDAFDVLSAAQEELLNEEARTGLMRVLEYARDAIREERRKATKHDAGVRVAAQVHAEGRSGVEREWEETAEFHHRWKVKARDVLARTEWRRMKLTKRCVSCFHQGACTLWCKVHNVTRQAIHVGRLRIEEARVEDEEKHEQELRKHARKARKEWHDKRNDRVTAWQGFAKTVRLRSRACIRHSNTFLKVYAGFVALLSQMVVVHS